MGTTSPFWGILADRYGRRNNLMLASVVVWYFGLLTSFSPSYFWILLLRGLVGAGMAGMPHGYVNAYMNRVRRKWVIYHMRPALLQISLRISAVRSGATLAHMNYYNTYIGFNLLMTYQN
ncbi:hypothetical protein DPMN_049184 [Dreissena polymorpha]|uniref:Major facilitator superfamily (MFS) profile domain-containing protein n=1 Tax=Dreissena polymorpha TaxID=45954 RepID=A0A9D4DAX2_DREPO|nr:hypothetical protein DPMN_049184 [Dreissena polymorpha]